jgi:SpoVK/Ycf46/Vps4 family AAA+-type ATPase
MSRFLFPANPILESVKFVFHELKKSELQDGALDHCLEKTTKLMDFFNCSEQQAVLIASLLQLHFDDEEVSVGELLTHFDLPMIAAGTLNEYLDLFVQRDWIRPEKDVRFHPDTRYILSAGMLRCVTLGDWSTLSKKEEKAENGPQLLNLFGKKLNAFKKGKTEFDSFSSEIESLLITHKKISLSKFIRQEKLGKEEACLFLHLCWQHYQGRSSVDVDRTIVDFRFDAEKRYYIRQAIAGQTFFLFKKELIEITEEDLFFASTSHELTEKSLKAIDPSAVKEIKQKSGTFLSTRQPDKIYPKELYYDSKLNELIDTLKETILPERFQEMSSRMKARGLKAGITILFFGEPGTGKTETALQLARHSGRTLLMADASKIRSKWVGETEKNIRELFEQYKSMKNKSKHCPILLFNEADAVLGKRRAVADRGDQMENSLQNILLEELEEFEGIFIATTNLEKHLDEAFDRRFLYKLKFENPGHTTRLSIWKNKFPELDESLLLSVCKSCHLTGAQVENIQKKATLDALLKPGFRITESYLIKLATEETSFREKGSQVKNVIGFGRNRKSS